MMFGGMIFSENGIVKRFNEKRSKGSGIINAGCYVFRKDIIKKLPNILYLIRFLTLKNQKNFG